MKILYPNAVIKRWVDGDTVVIDVDLGFKVWSEQRFRITGINTPEKKEAGWKEATARSNELAPQGTAVTIECIGYDRYGRWIATIVTQKDSVNVGETLVNEGLAIPYKV